MKEIVFALCVQLTAFAATSQQCSQNWYQLDEWLPGISLAQAYEQVKGVKAKPVIK